jgi:hypothetical protein
MFILKLLLLFFCYSIACYIILHIHQLSPTNLAGPGLDLPVLLIALISAITILARSILKLGNKKITSGFFAINMLGSLTMLALIYYEFTVKG